MLKRCADIEGFSLVEMLIALSLSAVLLIASVKTFTFLWKHWDEEALQTEVVQALQLAAREASLRHEPIVWCLTQDNLTCTTMATNGHLIGWHEDGHLQLLRVYQPQSQRGHLYFRSYPKYREWIQFQWDLIPKSDNASIWYCPKRVDSPVWAVVLNAFNHVRIIKPDKFGRIVDGHGQVLRC